VLSQHLKELEAYDIITRLQYDPKLQRVEYSLSAKGASLLPILKQLQNWGLQNIKSTLSIEQMLSVTMQ
jgi:DNA-binding HxlR family transcriptional regulator